MGTLIRSQIKSPAEMDGNGTMLILATGPGFDASAISEEFLLEARGSTTEPGPAAHPRENIVEQADWHGKCTDIDHRWAAAPACLLAAGHRSAVAAQLVMTRKPLAG